MKNWLKDWLKAWYIPLLLLVVLSISAFTLVRQIVRSKRYGPVVTVELVGQGVSFESRVAPRVGEELELTTKTGTLDLVVVSVKHVVNAKTGDPVSLKVVAK